MTMPFPQRHGAVRLSDLLSGNFEINPYSPQAAGLVIDLPVNGRLSGTTWRNMGSLSASATLSGATWITSMFGPTVNFDGVNDRVTAALPGTYSTLTASCWQYWRGVTGNAVLQSLMNIGPWNASGCCALFLAPATGTVYCYRWPGYLEATNWAISLAKNVWSHIAVVVLTASATLYVNGVSQGTKTSGGVVGPTLILGNSSDLYYDYDGMMVDARVNTVALPPSVIWQMAQPDTMYDLYRPLRRFWAVKAAGWNAALAAGSNVYIGPGVNA